MLKYKFTRLYGTLWIIYKLTFPFLLYYDLKLYVIILALANPISMFALDVFEFYRLWRHYRINFDKLYFIMHLFTDFILLLNGLFVWLIEYSSEATSSSSLVNNLDPFFYGYRIFLIVYIIVKFVILIGEIILS